MSKHIAQFSKTSDEYKKLEDMVSILKEMHPNRQFWIEDTWFDAGQDWMWTTILSQNVKLDMPYQYLYPVDQKTIIESTTKNELIQLANHLQSR